MSFFYGVNETTPTNSSSMSPTDKTILPGHNFKNAFMTSTIAVVVITMICLFTIALISWRVPTIAEPKDPDSKEIGKKHPSSGTGAICCYFIMIDCRTRYLLFELIIRICTELRLTVPYAFIAIDIPTRFFLMLAELLLLLCLWNNTEIIRQRLNLKNDVLSYISRPFAMIGAVTILLVFFVERITFIVMMVKQGFRWGRPDAQYYAISRTAYAGACLLLSSMLWIRFIRMWFVYRRRVRSGFFTDRCGKVVLHLSLKLIPLFLVAYIGPMITIRAATAFCFTFFFRLMKKRQNPDLELLRMAMVCLPFIVIAVGLVLIRKEDLAIKLKETTEGYASDINLLRIVQMDFWVELQEARDLDDIILEKRELEPIIIGRSGHGKGKLKILNEGSLWLKAKLSTYRHHPSSTYLSLLQLDSNIKCISNRGKAMVSTASIGLAGSSKNFIEIGGCSIFNLVQYRESMGVTVS
ncbi:uncharacterized protein BDR25DRAFT_353385 [Lindgomyces ingoldianus]|uniref:Uncharacterized protein n=1 Tax=Lindgomyces ingoldianus TaxID=673940 RepID=A0ACB6QZC6_9PLEO|nr:uncharacterized protein BDR25DRAFT_353385 [Lindgomyces ingoldianus]KAF2472348.1 hypothetical protein BDR25DRAFT_353385 [Lindgomyces ingoldianus]